MPKSEDLSRSLEINAIWTFDTEFPTIFIKSCTYITFKSAVKHRQLGYGYPRGQTVHLAEATTIMQNFNPAQPTLLLNALFGIRIQSLLDISNIPNDKVHATVIPQVPPWTMHHPKVCLDLSVLAKKDTPSTSTFNKSNTECSSIRPTYIFSA